MKVHNIPKIITGGLSESPLGTIKYVNDFKFKPIKRFYKVDLPRKGIIRAFHGHMKEEKYVFASSGETLVCAIRLSDKNKPSKNETVYKFKLSAKHPQILHIPKKYANGIESLSRNSSVIFFSTSTLNTSLNDDYRFHKNYWGKIWI